MNKTLIALLIAVLVITACGPAATPTATAPPAATSAPAATSPPAATVKPTEAPTAVPTAAPTEPPQPKRLLVGFQFAPRSGWAMETDDAFVLTNMGVAEPLIRVNFDGQLAPHLAESWERADENTWEFKLRSGVKFQNGEPFNADAVIKALEYVIGRPTPPRAFRGRTYTFEAGGEDQLIIRTAEPDALLPSRLSSPNASILAPSAYTEGGTVNIFGTGTGPFIASEDVPEQSVTLVKNENYWGGPVNLDEVQVLWVPDSTTRSGMLLTGELDLVQEVPIPQIPILESDPNTTVIKFKLARTRSLYMNNSREPFSNPLVRQAMQHAIDKAAIVAAILEGVGEPALARSAPMWPGSILA